MNENANETKVRAQTCEVCIIGAGIAGLNALYVATQYLKKTDRVIVIDKRDGPGGMWADVYDYARLHQPHPTFTVGDMPWNWGKSPDYLAKGWEVQEHLTHCYRTLCEKLEVLELFGHTVTHCDEIGGEGGAMVRIECEPEGGTGTPRVIHARKVIKALGFDVPRQEPLRFTSRGVVSTTPAELRGEEGFDRKAPAYVIGGGKTGMDTANALISDKADRSVTLINGRGAVFAERDTFFPPANRRWRDGTLVATAFRDLALAFNGANEDQAFDYLRRNFAIGVGKGRELFFFGILSRAERDKIESGLCDIVNDYLEDVVDGENGPEMVLRGGERRPVEPGSVFVNCTGHLLRHGHDYEPYLSPGGAVLTITPRSMAHFLSSVSAYFLSHLFFRGKLREAGLYEFDGESILKKNGRVYHTALISLSVMNLILMIQALPFRVVNRCGLDFDRLYPLPRRALALLDLKINGHRHVAHCRTALDRVRKLHGVRCGPLAGPADRAAHRPSPDQNAGGRRLRNDEAAYVASPQT